MSNFFFFFQSFPSLKLDASYPYLTWSNGSCADTLQTPLLHLIIFWNLSDRYFLSAVLAAGTVLPEHNTPILVSSHWFALRFWIKFKLSLLVFKALAPTYNTDLLTPYSTIRPLRSSSQDLLTVSVSHSLIGKGPIAKRKHQTGLVYCYYLSCVEAYFYSLACSLFFSNWTYWWLWMKHV